MRKKLNNQKGFTTVELLVVCVLLILFSAILSLGTGLVADTLKESMAYSESQTLNGILTNAISDQIRFQGRVCIYRGEAGNGEEDGKVYVKDVGADEGVLLLSSSAYPNGIKVKTLTISENRNPVNPPDGSIRKPTVGKIYKVELVLEDKRGDLSSSIFEVKCHYGSVT